MARMAQFALDHLNAAPSARTAHTMGTVLSAAHQVVAGSNYRVTFTIDPGPTSQTVTATVWEQPWLDRIEVTELTVQTPLPDHTADLSEDNRH